jgi:hypothetical protein
MPNCPDLAVAWSGQLAFDAICFLLTLRKSLALIGQTGHGALVATLLRDGKYATFLAQCLILICWCVGAVYFA